MNKTDKIKKKLQIVMYVLIILSILRSFIARASAESMPDYVQDYLHDNLSERNFPSSFNSYLSDAITTYNCQYFVCYCIGVSGVPYYYLFLSPYERTFVPMSSGSTFYMSGGYAFTGTFNGSFGQQYLGSTVSIPNATGRSYWFTWVGNGSPISAYYNTITYKTGTATYNGRTVYSIWNNQSRLVYNNWGTYSGASVSNVIAYGNMLTDVGSLQDVSTTVPDPVDNRFHARTFKNSYNQNMLEIKWDCNVYPNTGSFTYLKSVLQLTLMVNGNQSTVSFDSDNFPDLFVTPNTSYIPYMFLDSVGNVVTLQDSDSAFLTKIQLTQYAYPSSASSSSATAYTASTVYNLSLTDSVQLPIWRDPTISQQGGHIIDIATGNVYDNVSFSPPDGYSQQHISDLESVPWADVKVISQVAVTGNTQNALVDLYENIAYVLMQDWRHFADSALTDFNDVAAYIQSENQYTDTYDIIVFLWNENGSELCWVTYTHRYYIRLMYKQFGNFQTIMEGSAAYVADIYDYLFSRLEPMNDNLIMYFDSALSNNQTILSYVQSINGFCNSIDNTLFSGFNSVIGSGGRSLTDIYNRLGDISVGGGGGFILNDFMTAFENKMSYLFVPTYDGLEDNFDTAIDDLGILALPFSFSYELISACKVPYSYTLDITFPSMSIPWHEEMEGGSVDSNLVLWEDYDLSFNPATVIPSDWLEFFQYLNALLVLVSVTLLTYRHIFRHSEGQGGNTL